MACTLTTGRELPCKDSVGGIKAVYLADYGTLGALTVDASGELTAIAGTPTLFQFDVKGNSSLEQTINSSRENGTTFYEQTLNLTLTKLDLATHFNHNPNELSGGQQQRVAIARALVTDPEVILADEPTGNLDSRSGAEVINIFEQLAQNGKTIILVTHDLNIAKRANRIINIQDGSVVAS